MNTDQNRPNVGSPTAERPKSGSAAPGKEDRSASRSNARPPHNNSFGSRLSNMEKAAARQAREFEQLKAALLKTSQENSDTLVGLLEVLQTWELVPRDPINTNEKKVEEEMSDKEKQGNAQPIAGAQGMSPRLKMGLQALAAVVSIGGAFFVGRTYEKKKTNALAAPTKK